MTDKSKARKFLLAGAILGGIFSLALSLLMDTMYADSFQGTWRDAIAKDLNTYFSLEVSTDSAVVYIVFFFVLAILTSFGAFLGFIFSFFMYKFFSLLTGK
jgi:hypothetical protein